MIKRRSPAKYASSGPTLREQADVPARVRSLVLRGLEAGLLHVQAPAGCGKTTVVLQTLLDEGIEPRWHTCSAEDTDPGRLLAGLTEVLGLSHTTGGLTAIAALATTEGLPSIAAALRPLMEEIVEETEDRTVLVVDDVDALLDSGASLAILDHLVLALLSRARVVLISRADPPLPSLAKPRLDGRAVRIGTADLLLREDEIALCARAVYGITLSPEEVASLFRVTAGWPIALRLALRLRDMGARFEDADNAVLTPEARSDLFAYLAAEVLDRVDGRIEDFLKRTAVLETLDPSVCARLTKEERPAALIQSLAGAGLPVMKTGWSTYRCHSLLREYFLARLDEKDLRDAHAAAGRAYSDIGDYSSALVHLVAAGDVRGVLRAAELHGRELFRAGRGRALLETVRSAPEPLLAEYPGAQYWAAFAASRMFEWEWATAALERVHAAALAKADPRMARDALGALAYMLNVWGRFVPAATAAHWLIEAIPADQVASRAAAALGHLVPGMTGSGQFKPAMELIRARLPELTLEPRAESEAEAFARAVAAITMARNGDFAGARAQLDLADVLLPGCSDDVVRTFLPWTRAMVGFLCCDPLAAEAAARAAETAALEVGDLQRLLECRALGAALHALRGDVDAANRGFSEVEELRSGIANFWVTILTLLTRPRRLLLAGDLAGAVGAADANHALASNTGEGWFICFSRLEVVYMRMLNGNHHEAREQARAALAEAETLTSPLLQYGASLMLAASSPDDEAASLAAALRIADEGDYRFLMPFAIQLPELFTALWRALGTNRHVRAGILLASAGPAAMALREAAPTLTEAAGLRAVEVLRGFGPSGRPALQELLRSAGATVGTAVRAALATLEAANPFGLSPRELEVLGLLRQGLRTKEIAERLVLTAATVSTHIQRIMVKTKTSSRAELLALAAREGPSGVK